MSISIIVAMSENRVIGKDGGIPWDVPSDRKHFKKITGKHPVIMGRKTWESIPDKFRPLPLRKNIVVTKQRNYKAEGAFVSNSLEEALKIASTEDSEVFVIGGVEIYREALPLTNRLFITVVQTICEGDAFFPDIDFSTWEIQGEEMVFEEEDQFPSSFLILTRKKPPA